VLEERSGLLTVVSGRLDGRVTITVVGYQPGVENTKKALRERLATVFDEFELTGVIV
jgi:acylphosphatase